MAGRLQRQAYVFALADHVVRGPPLGANSTGKQMLHAKCEWLHAKCEWLAVSSDKSTVHVLALADHVVTGPPLGANSAGEHLSSKFLHDRSAGRSCGQGSVPFSS